MSYLMTFSFKEGKIRAGFVIITMIYKTTHYLHLIAQGGFASASIFKKNGDVRLAPTKLDIENFANGIIKGLTDSINGKTQEW